MTQRPALDHLQPWLGLIAGALGWGAAHQVASASIFDDCRAASPLFVLAIGALALAVAIAGGLFSLAVRRRAEETPGRRFVGLIGALLAALAGFAIILQSLSALIIPPCTG